MVCKFAGIIRLPNSFVATFSKLVFFVESAWIGSLDGYDLTNHSRCFFGFSCMMGTSMSNLDTSDLSRWNF